MYIDLDARLNFIISRHSIEKIISLIFLIWSALLILISLCDFLLIAHEAGLPIVSKLIYVALIISSLFWLIHCVSYTDKLLRSVLLYNIEIFITESENFNIPKVAVVIPVFNEEPLIVENSLKACKQINYKSFEIYLLDDTTDKKNADELFKLANRLDINYIHRSNRRGYKAGAINDLISEFSKNVDYILIIDADHKVKPQILRELVPILEKNTSISFLQTPQYFTKETSDKLAVVYSIQQHIFNKHLCRGLNVNDAAVMTGSNVIIRLSHLKAIGGMDESCITEDIATSFNFRFHGYRGIFLDKIYAEGIAPPTLSAYFIQQERWAYGTTQNFKKILRFFFKTRRQFQCSTMGGIFIIWLMVHSFWLVIHLYRCF